MLTSNGKLSYGVIPDGLVPEEPKTKEVRLSLGSDVEMKGAYRYGLVHIMKDHYAQLKALGFDTVEAFIKHVLENLDNATLDKKHKNGISYFVFTKPFYSTIHSDRKRIDSLIVSLYEGNDYWDIINMWRGKQSYIENKKEQEQPYPPNRLVPHFR